MNSWQDTLRTTSEPIFKQSTQFDPDTGTTGPPLTGKGTPSSRYNRYTGKTG